MDKPMVACGISWVCHHQLGLPSPIHLACATLSPFCCHFPHRSVAKPWQQMATDRRGQAAANEWQVLWPVQQLRFEWNQAYEKLHLVTGYLHSEKNCSDYPGGVVLLAADLRLQGGVFNWQARCALRKKELSSLQQNGEWCFQRRSIRKLDAGNPTCNGGSLDEFNAQVVRKA